MSTKIKQKGNYNNSSINTKKQGVSEETLIVAFSHLQLALKIKTIWK